jgi:hypothetical protein
MKETMQITENPKPNCRNQKILFKKKKKCFFMNIKDKKKNNKKKILPFSSVHVLGMVLISFFSSPPSSPWVSHGNVSCKKEM